MNSNTALTPGIVIKLLWWIRFNKLYFSGIRKLVAELEPYIMINSHSIVLIADVANHDYKYGTQLSLLLSYIQDHKISEAAAQAAKLAATAFDLLVSYRTLLNRYMECTKPDGVLYYKLHNSLAKTRAVREQLERILQI